MVRYFTFVAIAGLMLVGQAELRAADWSQFGGSSHRNAVADAKLPNSWDVDTGRNIGWSAKLGSQTYGSPVVAGGKVFIGTNNAAGYDRRYPRNVDLCCLVCFSESDGSFLWQHSNPLLAGGRAFNWPLQGVCSTPLVESDRLWYVNNRCEIVCLDTHGFRDCENDGPFKTESSIDSDDADVIWKYDMRT